MEHEGYKRYESSFGGEVMLAAAELVDRAQIEAQAWQLIRQRNQLPKVEIYRQERTDNARTALMEALTASGHLSRIELTGTIEEINAQVISRLLNGWSNTLPFHEKQRRFAELCNELTWQRIEDKIISGELPEDTAFNEMSDYPLPLSDSVARSLGYRSVNKKGMVRSTHLVKRGDGYTRVIEQVSRTNGTWPSTFAFFQDRGIRTTGQGSADIVALSSPQVYSLQGYVDGVVDIQRRLDTYAGHNIMYGDKANPHHVPYEQLRTESFEREEQIEYYIDTLANSEERLDAAQAAGAITRAERDALYGEEVRQILRSICMLAPEYTEDCFGKEAVPYYLEASNYVARGQVEQATMVVDQAKEVEQPIIFCGVLISPEKAKELGLDISDLNKMTSTALERWQWKKGICRVKSCSSPKPTEVGPCSVCRQCQACFDKGNDPTKAYKASKSITSSLFIFRKESKEELKNAA